MEPIRDANFSVKHSRLYNKIGYRLLTHLTDEKLYRCYRRLLGCGHVAQDIEIGMLCPTGEITADRLHIFSSCKTFLHKLIPWEPTYSHRGQGRSKSTFVDVLIKDTGINSS